MGHVAPQAPHHCHIRPASILDSMFFCLGCEHLQNIQFGTPTFEVLPKTQKKIEMKFCKKCQVRGRVRIHKNEKRGKNKIKYIGHKF
jgi:transcription elongation factor Elf1